MAERISNRRVGDRRLLIIAAVVMWLAALLFAGLLLVLLRPQIGLFRPPAAPAVNPGVAQPSVAPSRGIPPSVKVAAPGGKTPGQATLTRTGGLRGEPSGDIEDECSPSPCAGSSAGGASVTVPVPVPVPTAHALPSVLPSVVP